VSDFAVAIACIPNKLCALSVLSYAVDGQEKPDKLAGCPCFID
jgi:hypothetical protein